MSEAKFASVVDFVDHTQQRGNQILFFLIRIPDHRLQHAKSYRRVENVVRELVTIIAETRSKIEPDQKFSPELLLVYERRGTGKQYSCCRDTSETYP